MKVGKGKKILMLTDGNIDNASSRIRAIQYIPYLQKNDYKVKLIPRIPKKSAVMLWRFFFFPLLKRWFSLKRLIALKYFHWDLVFIQRSFLSEDLLVSLKSRKIPVLFDFDDAIYLHARKPKNREKTALMVRYADRVIVSTDFLKAFCQQQGKEAFIIPSPVETNRIRPTDRAVHELVTIGWMGSAWTTDFLKIVEKPLQDLAKKYSFRFLTVGAKAEFKIEGIHLESYPWKFEQENDQIGKMDIGIMPLPDNEWSQSKGGYKLLQYMSGGIPCVASPVGINSWIIKPGINGFLASTNAEWFESLEKLLLDPLLRIELGHQGRKDAVLFYSRDICFEKLLHVLQETMNKKQISVKSIL